MGVQAPPELLGIHTNLANVIALDIDKLAFSGAPAPANLSADEKRAYDRLSFVYAKGIGYGFQMGLRPQTLYAAKAQINRFGTPTATELQSSNDLFFPLLALPGAQARRARIRNIGYGVRSDFELNSAGTFRRSGGRMTVTRLHSPADRRPDF